MQIKGTDAAGGSNKTKTKTKTVNTKKDKDEEKKTSSAVKPSQKKSDELTALIEEDKAVAKAQQKLTGTWDDPNGDGRITALDARTRARENGIEAGGPVLRKAARLDDWRGSKEQAEKRAERTKQQEATRKATALIEGEDALRTAAGLNANSAKTFAADSDGTVSALDARRIARGETGARTVGDRPVYNGDFADSADFERNKRHRIVDKTQKILAEQEAAEKAEKAKQEEASARRTGKSFMNGLKSGLDQVRDAADTVGYLGRAANADVWATYGDRDGNIDISKMTPDQRRAYAANWDSAFAALDVHNATKKAEELAKNPTAHDYDEFGKAWDDVAAKTEAYQDKQRKYLDLVYPDSGTGKDIPFKERQPESRAPKVTGEQLMDQRIARETDEDVKKAMTALKPALARIIDLQDATESTINDGNFYSETVWNGVMQNLSEVDKATYDLKETYLGKGANDAMRAYVEGIVADLKERNQRLYAEADRRRGNASLWNEENANRTRQALGEDRRADMVAGDVSGIGAKIDDAQLMNIANGNRTLYNELKNARAAAEGGDLDAIDEYIAELQTRLGRTETRDPNVPAYVPGNLTSKPSDKQIEEAGAIQAAIDMLGRMKLTAQQNILGNLSKSDLELIDAYNNDHDAWKSLGGNPDLQRESMEREKNAADKLDARNNQIKARTGYDWTELANMRRAVLEHEEAEEYRADTAEFAADMPLPAWIAARGANAIGGVFSLAGMIDAALDPDKEFTKDSPFAALQQFGETVNATQAETIKDDVSTFFSDELGTTDGAAKFMGGAAALGYSAASSMADSLIAMGLGEVMPTAGPLGASDVLFGLNAFTEKYTEAKANNSPTAQAMITALGAGVFEALFEHVSVENMKLFKQVNPNTGMDFIWNAIKAFGSEGAEELTTDLANTVWDIFVNGASSDYYQNVSLYMLAGDSAQDAKRKAGGDLALQYLQSFVAGGLAGAGHAAIGMAGGSIRYALQTKRAYANYIDTGSFFPSKRGNADVKAALKAPDALKYEGANQEAVRDAGAQMWNRILNTAEAASEMGLKDKNITALLADSERIKKGEDPQTDLKKARKYAIAINQAVARRADIEYKQHLKDAFKTILTEQGAKSPDILLEALANEVRNRRTDADGNTEGGAVGPEAYLIKTQTAQRALAEYERAVELDRGGDENNAALPAWYTRMRSRDSLSDFRSGAALGLYRLGVKQIDRSRLNVGEPGYVKADGTFVSATPTGVSNTDGYGKTVLHMSDGTQVDMNNVTFADGDTAVIYKAAGDLPITAAKGLVEKWQAARERGTTTPAEVFASGYSRFFSTGRAGIAFETAEEASRDIERAIGQDAAKMAHAQGENFRMNPADIYVDMTADEAKVVTFGRGESATLYDADDPFYMDLREGVNYAPDVKQEGLTLDQKAQVYLVSAGLNAKKGRTPVVVHSNIFSGDNAELNGFYDKENNVLHVSLNAEGGLLLRTVAHEMAHQLKQTAPEAWNALRDYVVQTLKDTPMGKSTAYDVKMKQLEAAYTYTSNGTRFLISNKAREGTREYIDELEEEMVSDSCFDVLGNEENVKEFAKQNLTGLKKIARWISDFLGRIRDAIRDISYNDAAVAALRKQTDKLERIRELFDAAIRESEANRSAGVTEGGETAEAEQTGTNGSEEIKTSRKSPDPFNELDKGQTDTGIALIDKTTESVAPSSVEFSRKTWEDSEYVKEREKTIQAMLDSIPGVTREEVEKYINDIDNIAYMIAKDSERLDYKAAPGRSMFVTNAEYGGSIDASTLCAKRALLTGTFSAIQRYLDNTVLKPEDILKLRNMMKDEHYIVSCGLCYVEGSRAQMGVFCEEFIKRFKQHYPDAEWVPDMFDVNTPEGVEDMRINHPDVYELYERFWNNHGKLVDSDKAIFASQQKPKLYAKRTEYKNEILDEFGGEKNKEKVRQKNLNGGIRIQSFSDFELPHMIDMMQVIMDMSRAGLKGQAYTKVPAFAWALGNTGLKINLSLIAKGVDENGKLIYDDVEGMPHEEAFHIRDTFSRDVGTILVVFDDAQLKAAMADPQIDFIIPFHRSQWKKSQYDDLGLPKTTKDFTRYQNEKFIVPHYHEFRGRQVREKAANYAPNSYWDFNISGKENAQVYLDMCAKNGRRPKFYELLDYHLDGRYSMKEDGSTDGYWKLLIDFKMYDNDGNGAEQMPVRPIFNMGGTGNAEMDAHSIPAALDAYKGGHDNFPVAKDVVKKFIEYKTGKTVSDEEVDDAIKRSKGRPRRTGEMKMSRKSAADRKDDEDYLAARARGDKATMRRIIEKRAKAAGYGSPRLYHGSPRFGFTRFDLSLGEQTIFATNDRKVAETYSGHTEVSRISDRRGLFRDPMGMSAEELLDAAKEHLSWYDDLELMSTEDRDKTVRMARDGIRDFLKENEHFLEERMADEDTRDATERIVESLKNIISAGSNAGAKEGRKAFDSAVRAMPDVYFFKFLKAHKLHEDFNDLIHCLDDGVVYFKPHGDIFSRYVNASTLREELNRERIKEPTRGIYELYGKIEHAYEFDAGGRWWNEIASPENIRPYTKENTELHRDAEKFWLTSKETGEILYERTLSRIFERFSDERLYDYSIGQANNPFILPTWGDDEKTTRQVADFAFSHGYDCVIIHNLKDIGAQTSFSGAADIYIFKNENQVKSADIETFDDDGNIILPSDRFNTEKDDIRWSRQADNKFLKTEIQESREKLDDAIDSMALGTKTNYEPAEKRVDREERRTLMLNYKSAASQGVRMAEEAVAEILETDTALKEALREAQRQTKLSKDIGYRLTAASVKRAADALTEAHPEITATKVAFASALSGLYKLMMDDRSLPGDEALELASQVAKTATGDPWGETTLAQHELAQEILGKYIDIGYQQTFGDKADEKIRDLKDKARKGIANEREKSRLKLAEARAEYKKKLKEQHSTDRDKYEERLGEYKEHHKEMMHEKVEQHAKSKRIEQIRKHVAELRRKLTNPTEKKHIPADMLKTVIKALDLFGELDNTAHGEKVKNALTDISDAYREAVTQQLAPPNEELLEIIDNFRQKTGDRTIRELSVNEIEGLWQVIRAVEKYVRESNQAHSEMLNRPISEMIEDLQHEISGKTVKPTRLNPEGKAAKAIQTAKSLELRNLKPVYFFRRFASDTMEKLFWALQNSELGWERIAQESRQVKWDADRAYDPNHRLWYERGTKPKTVTLELERGDKITLTALQAASLWLMAKDEGGATHLMQGGFIVEKPEYKKGSDGKYHPEVSDHNIRLTTEDLVTLGNALTEDQKAYATRMQKYLAGPLAAHGNAVTQKLYELDRFTNQTYWPLRSAQEFLDSDPNNPARADTVSVRSPGFTKARIPHASNPVVLEDMFTVWARHVNGMALYASMTLPLDDMLKVWNTRNYAGENIDAQSVKMEIERRFGKEYVRYMEQFLRDINGGLRGDPSASFINSMLSHFKAAAVMGNVSVALQQPASVGRAMAFIKPQYLIVGAAKTSAHYNRSREELLEHAPIAGLKARGAFDVMISTSLNQSLIEREDLNGRTVREWANTVLGYGAEFGDNYTWTVMWEACKAQVKTQEGLTGEALLNKAAELFNKTMVMTQVYDSVFSQSELMRAKDTGVKEVTAFQAEPTTSLNMIEDAIFQLKNKRMSKGDAAKVFAGVMTSIILANAASSLIGAIRKKDEEQNFWEKFLASFTSGVGEDMLPITYIPIVKDIFSVFQGYDMERSSFSGIKNLYDTLTRFLNPDRRDPESFALLIGAMADLTGLPGSRLTKDIFAAARFAANLYNPDKPTFSAEGLWDAVKGEWTNPLTKTIEKQLEASRTAKLYRDYVNGSDDYEKRYEMYLDEGYTEDEIEKSLRAYYANQDKRTQQAKKLAEDGDISGYKALVEEMAADTGLSKSFIADAVLGYGKHVGDSIYTSSMVVSAFNAGSPDSAEILEAVIEARAQVYMSQGKDAETALKDSMSAMRTAFTSFFKTPYQDALKAGNTDEAERIRQIVVGSGVYADAEKAVANWAKEVSN